MTIVPIQLKTRQDLKNTSSLHKFLFVKFVKSGTVVCNIEENMNLQNIINLLMQIVTKY